MAAANGNAAEANGGASEVNQLGGWNASEDSQATALAQAGSNATVRHDLYFGGARMPLVEVVPDLVCPSMFRVHWPDGLISPPANLTRCKEAARVWAERQVLTDLRKKRGVGALKSLDNFSWSSRHVAGIRPKEARTEKMRLAHSGENARDVATGVR